MKLLRNIFLAVLVLSAALCAEDKQTLASIRAKFLNQQILIDGHIADVGKGPQLLSWSLAEKGQRIFAERLNASYRGKSAIVTSITMHDNQADKVNAMGDVTPVDQIVNPYFDLVATLEDGTAVVWTGYPSMMSSDIHLASENKAKAVTIRDALNGMIGKTVYATGFSRLYKPDSSLGDLLSSQAIIYQITLPPLFKPIEIVSAKYNEAENVTILKLKLPDGSLALAFTPSLMLNQEDGPIEDKILFGFLTELPSSLTPKEISAIQERTIFRGMSDIAVEYCLGSPDHKNDWGRGGKQLVYFDGRIFVYMDSKGTVEDWQTLGK